MTKPTFNDDRSLYTTPGFGAWLLGSIGISAVFMFQFLYPTLIGPISNVLPAACAAGALLSALLCVKRYGFAVRTKFQAAWASYSIGFGLWVAAEMTWAIYYFVLAVPIPQYSVADIFYIGGYLPVFVGQVLYLDTFHNALKRNRVGVAAAAIALAVVVVTYAVLPAELATGGSLIKILDDLAFILLDLLLFSLVVLTFTIFAGGRISKWLVAMGLASLLYVVGDEDFLVQTANGTYYNGSYNDLIFLLAYTTYALAFYIHRREW